VAPAVCFFEPIAAKKECDSESVERVKVCVHSLTLEFETVGALAGGVEGRIAMSERGNPPIQRPKTILISLAVLGWLLFLWFLYGKIFAPMFPDPDTEQACLGFEKVTGLSSEDVSQVYYDRPYDFNGDTTDILRFSYTSEKWLDRFLSRFQRHPTVQQASNDYGASWWDTRLISDMPEHYASASDWRGTFIWVDRDRQLIYLVKHD
jgi:hypothetical protein